MSKVNERYIVHAGPLAGTPPLSGGRGAYRYVANGYFDPTKGLVRPFIGGGIGVADVKTLTTGPRAPCGLLECQRNRAGLQGLGEFQTAGFQPDFSANRVAVATSNIAINCRPGNDRNSHHTKLDQWFAYP